MEAKESEIEMRVPRGSKYFYIDSLLEVRPTLDGYDKTAKKRFELGNYFISQEQAEEACIRLKSVLFGFKHERKFK